MILSDPQRAKLRTRDGYGPLLKIDDRASGRLVSFPPNEMQRQLFACIDAAREAERPVRILGLKARRLGFSTAIQHEFARLAFTTQRFSATTIAHKTDSSGYLFGMCETMWEELPSVLRVPKKRGNAGRVLELVNGSALRVETAGDREAGRATAARAVHASEAAYWPDLARTLGALRQIVPDEPGTFFIIESTANGVGNAFHAECERAMNGDSDYEFLFFPWFADASFRRPTDPLEDLDGEEIALRSVGVDDEQLAWRRWAIENRCAGSLDLFHQEFPATPSEAFLSSGRPVFANLEGFVPTEPRFIGDIEGMPARNGKLQFVANPKGRLRIWKVPRRGVEKYAVFADVAGEVSDDVYEARGERDGEDYCCAQVISLTTGEQVAEWHGRLDPDQFALELARIGKLYGDALMAPEVNGVGQAVMALLTNLYRYPRMYRRRHFDTTDQRWTERIGWKTDSTTRPLMLAELKRVARESPVRLKSEGLKREMRTFVKNRRGKEEADTGCHDDRVIAMAGACEVYREHAERPIRIGPKPKQPKQPLSISQRAPRVSTRPTRSDSARYPAY